MFLPLAGSEIDDPTHSQYVSDGDRFLYFPSFVCLHLLFTFL
jgi:hypothetical protein